MSELKYWLWLSNLRGVRAKDAVNLLRHFRSPEDIYFADEKEYRALMTGDVRPLLNKDMTYAKKVLEDCDKKKIAVLTIKDAAYPDRLKNIYDPPLVLYIKGKLPAIDDEAAIGIVGTRRCTSYGLDTAKRIGYDIAAHGGLVVTGLALGIDAAAAAGALHAGGNVVGVLGCGTDVVYPSANRSLFEKVESNGVLISEYPPGARPERANFPRRNRIISGISLGVVVVEAPERSGALITAGLATDQGRDVFAVPGNIDAESFRGSNGLLKEGATPVTSGMDVIEQYIGAFPDTLTLSTRKRWPFHTKNTKNKLKEEESRPETEPETTKKVIDKDEKADYIDVIVNPEEMSGDELSILRALDTTLHIDEIIERSGLSAHAVSSALTMLEISGAVRQEAGKRFAPHFKFIE